MKKKLILSISTLSTLATLPLISASCSKEDKMYDKLAKEVDKYKTALEKNQALYNDKTLFPFIKEEFNETWKLLTKEIVQTLFNKYKIELEKDLVDDKEDLDKGNYTTADEYMDLVYNIKMSEKMIKDGFAIYLEKCYEMFKSLNEEIAKFK